MAEQETAEIPKITSIPGHISLEDLTLSVDTPIRACIYGAAGTGKTTLAASFPRPIWIADFDLKLKPIYGEADIFATSYPVDGTDANCEKVLWQFRRDWRKAAKSTEIKTMVLDSLTSYDSINLRAFCKMGGNIGEGKGATLPVYKDQSAYYSMFFTEIKNITDKHVLILGHERHVTEGKGDEKTLLKISPLITGQAILEKLPSQFEELWYLQRKGGSSDERLLHYRPYRLAEATSTILKGAGKITLPDLGAKPSAHELIVQEAKRS